MRWLCLMAAMTWGAPGWAQCSSVSDPDQRYRIFQRFYGLAPGLIARFYAGRSNTADKLRILSGKPPVSVRRAIAALAKLDWK